VEQQEAGCSLEEWQVPNQTTLLASVCLKQHSLFSLSLRVLSADEPTAEAFFLSRNDLCIWHFHWHGKLIQRDYFSF
jgi:hypothetical protein